MRTMKLPTNSDLECPSIFSNCGMLLTYFFRKLFVTAVCHTLFCILYWKFSEMITKTLTLLFLLFQYYVYLTKDSSAMVYPDFEYALGTLEYMRDNQNVYKLFVTADRYTLFIILYWKFSESNYKNSDFPILTLPVYLTSYSSAMVYP